MLGFCSGQNGYEAINSRQELGALSATVPMLRTYVHPSLGGQTASLSTLDFVESGGVTPCLTGISLHFGPLISCDIQYVLF